ncbi:hypothetical protein [Candidatus Paracaedibacter symbiosus]|uniref:hypothetical protein n=1 Tax=Candidatus Paracaedibacter symbiosus TaxID=244582 RepID=UPI001E4486F2|nr:hypothetical protein [Candidatus Paracaedibacter symbiosus]
MHSVPEALKASLQPPLQPLGTGILDDKSPGIIKEFQQKEARILILSGILTGKWSHISDIMIWRINNLNKARQYF